MVCTLRSRNTITQPHCFMKLLAIRRQVQDQQYPNPLFDKLRVHKDLRAKPETDSAQRERKL